MILDAYGRPVQGSTLGISIKLMRAYNEEAERLHQKMMSQARVEELRVSLGLSPYAGDGDTIRVRLPRRYQ